MINHNLYTYINIKRVICKGNSQRSPRLAFLAWEIFLPRCSYEKSTRSDGVLIYYFLFAIDYFYRIFDQKRW